MKRFMFAALLIASGASVATPSKASRANPAPVGMESAATNRVRDTMKDPDSAKFRNVFTAASGAICGEVNAKNEYGGYVGFQHFMIETDGSLFFDNTGPSFPGLIAMACRKT